MPSSLPPKLGPFEEWIDSLGPSTAERRRGIYVILGALCTAIVLFTFSLIDLLAGRLSESLQSFVIAALFVAISAQYPRRTTDKGLARVILVISLAVICHETMIGANGGFTFLWFYLLPLGCFFVLGRREGAAWFLSSLGLMAWLLFAVDRQVTADGDVGTIALATYLVLGMLSYGLESARFRLTDLLVQENDELQQALSDLEALYGLVPICAACKSVRDDQGYWHDIETYLSKHPAVELQSAFCPDCRQRALSEGETLTTADDPDDPTREIVLRSQEHRRRRKIYFSAGMAVLIPSLGYFAGLDVWAGRYMEGGLVFGLLAFFIGLLVLLHKGQSDRLAYELAAVATLVVLVYELYIGAYEGYGVLWLYSYPTLTIFVLGKRGLLWSIAVLGVCAFFLLLPIGFVYPIAMGSRFLATFGLVITMAFGFETARKRSEEQLSEESETLRRTLDEVTTLRGLLPMCPYCKKVRDDQGFWEQIETHVTRISGAQFTHGLCPNCAEQTFAEIQQLHEHLADQRAEPR